MQRRTVTFLTFFSIVITLYAALNAYIFFKGVAAVPEAYKSFYTAVYIILASSYVVGRVLERVKLSWFSSLLVWVGSFWLAAMVYFFFSCLFIDILRLIDLVVPIFPSFLTTYPEQTKHTIGLVVAAFVSFVVCLGYWNARIARIKTIEIIIHKNSHEQKTFNIVAVSDIHLGTIICKSRLEYIVREMNELNPDLVLLPGDVVDEDLGPVIKQNLGETLRAIKSKFGVVAITGNHEYIGGVEEACRYLTEHGVRMLRDEILRIDGGLYVVGREDRSLRQFEGKRRKPLEELMAGVDKSYPVILMDHQPFHLDEAMKNGVDLQLSGHTHHGQMWPFNFITEKVYELSWGYMKKGNTHIYVSCGVGTWGPPVRIGNRPEIVNVRLRFE